MIAALYRVLLRAYPRSFRERYGAAMTAAFVDLASERRAGGGLLALGVLLVQTAVDVATNAAAEHRSERRRHRQYVSLHGRRSPGSGGIDGLRADVRFAWRSLAARPAVVVSVVLTLSVGTGATTAIFSVVDAVLLRPLPYPEDAQLVTIAERQPSNPLGSASFSAVFAWKTLPALANLASYTVQPATFNAGIEPERVDGAMVSPTFFEVLGVSPVVGRTFHAGDRLFDPDRKIVLSHAVWMRHFGGDPSVIGRQVALDSGPHTIVGVMPRGFGYPTGIEFWASLSPDMASVKELKDVRFLQTIGRLSPHASLAQLQAQLNDTARPHESLPAAERGWRPEGTRLREQTIGAVRRPLILVLGAVALLTVVGCCNAAAMLLARGAVRSREIAVRAAVGASRSRIMRQLLLESAIIGCGAAVLGTCAGALMLQGIVALSLGQVPRIETVEVNARVLTFITGFSMVVAALVGIAPALSLSRVGPAQAIHSARSTGYGPRKARGLRLLVVAECSLALVILAGGGLLINSFIRLTHVETGVDPSNVLTAKISVPVMKAWSGDPVKRRLYVDLLDRVAHLPEVRRAAVTSRLPLSELRGGAPVGTPATPNAIPRAVVGVVSEEYFATVGARLVTGRVFSTEDHDQAPRVAVVNEWLAAALWPGESAIGKTLVYRHYLGPVTLTVAGVVAPIRYDSLSSGFKPELFVSFRQNSLAPMSLVLRTAGDPADIAAAIRTHVRQADPTGTVTVEGVSTLERQLAATTARPRFFAALIGTFAGAALLLTALGIHGVLSFWTEQRQQEFGVRVALGANRAELYRQVVGQGAGLALAGITVGLAVAVAASRLLAGLLYGIPASDVATYAAVSGLLLASAVGACVPAARRAASVDPVQMLRTS